VIGALLNAAAVLVGGALGLFFGARLPDRIKQAVMTGMGLFTAALGLKLFVQTGNPLIVLEIKPIHIDNFLPALIVAPLIAWILEFPGIR
jgi:uncharacterized membrane protein YqgA involved in biofilm formation